MANINEKTGQIEFSIEELDAAWENSPKIVNKDIDDYRLCYICKYPMQHSNFVGVNSNDVVAWALDLINAKKPKLEKENYIAVHCGCVPNREKMDSRKQLKLIKATKWQAPE